MSVNAMDCMIVLGFAGTCGVLRFSRSRYDGALAFGQTYPPCARNPAVLSWCA